MKKQLALLVLLSSAYAFGIEYFQYTGKETLKLLRIKNNEAQEITIKPNTTISFDSQQEKLEEYTHGIDDGEAGYPTPYKNMPFNITQSPLFKHISLITKHLVYCGKTPIQLLKTVEFNNFPIKQEDLILSHGDSLEYKPEITTFKILTETKDKKSHYYYKKETPLDPAHDESFIELPKSNL